MLLETRKRRKTDVGTDKQYWLALVARYDDLVRSADTVNVRRTVTNYEVARVDHAKINMERAPEALSYMCAGRGTFLPALIGPYGPGICCSFPFAAVIMHVPNLWFLPGVKYNHPQSAKELTNSCAPTSCLLCGSRGNEVHRP